MGCQTLSEELRKDISHHETYCFSLLVAIAMAVPAPGREATPEAEADPAVLASYSTAPYAYYGLHYPLYHYPYHHYYLGRKRREAEAEADSLPEAESLPEAGPEAEADPEAWYYAHYGHYGYGYGYPYYYGYYGYPYGRYWYGK